MALKISNTWMLLSTGLIIFNLEATLGEPQVPCNFIFGDSLLDNGNNNKLRTTLKANYPPYGIDFSPDGAATGRFTNGRTMVDIIAELLGFENYIPAFATAKGREIMKGVNYASGGAGIRNETGSHMGDRICMDKQLINHKKIISNVASLLGNQTAAEIFLQKCLYIVGAGNNDYMNNYFLPKYYNTSKLYTPKQYAKNLKKLYSQQLKKLYNFGARKITIFGLSPSGCTPAMREVFSEILPKCVHKVNRAVELFNAKLKLVVDDLNAKLQGANFTYINIYSIQLGDILGHGSLCPFNPCCAVSEENKGLCIPELTPCIVRSFHLFFDNYHPTETLNTYTAKRAYIAATSTDVYPMDISDLMKV